MSGQAILWVVIVAVLVSVWLLSKSAGRLQTKAIENAEQLVGTKADYRCTHGSTTMAAFLSDKKVFISVLAAPKKIYDATQINGWRVYFKKSSVGKGSWTLRINFNIIELPYIDLMMKDEMTANSWFVIFERMCGASGA